MQASDPVGRSHLLEPLDASELPQHQEVLNKVWIYNNELEANRLATAFIDSLEETVEFGEGTSQALNRFRAASCAYRDRAPDVSR